MKHATMVPSQLQQTRPEYMMFKPKKFKEHIYQEVRRGKYINYLNKKRNDKKSY